jgi:hypothetical protein
MRPNLELQELHAAYHKCEAVSIYGIIGMIGKCRICGLAHIHYVYDAPGVWHPITRRKAAQYIREARRYDRRSDRMLLMVSGKRVTRVETGLGKTSRAA